GVGCGVWGKQSCLLPFTFYLLPFTFYLLPFTFYLLPFAFCLLPIAYCLLPSSQWSRIFDKLSFDELAQPIR
ncbi:hypothetical protein, partial [Microcystis aeruginosa]|uniref:hypothetical protein n=1 Tax=Microcystis aeruginosa TaxID=1126 RepID=UPI003A0FF787